MKFSLLIAAGLCIAMLACNNSDPDDKYNDAADSTIVPSGSSNAAVENPLDSVHKFIRTADLKFKVKDVEKATYKIEDIIVNHGGYVTLSELNSNIDKQETIQISNDSSLENITYTIKNNITFRVPNTKLDTVLKDVSKLVDHLDYRIVKANDISLQFYSNRLQKQRSENHSERLMNAVEKQGKKLNEISAAEDAVQHNMQDAHEAALSDMSLNDQVNYSTVQMAIYQRPGIKRELVKNDENVSAYEPGFGTKALSALQFGLNITENIFLFFLRIWPVVLLFVSGIFLYNKYSFKQKK